MAAGWPPSDASKRGTICRAAIHQGIPPSELGTFLGGGIEQAVERERPYVRMLDAKIHMAFGISRKGSFETIAVSGDAALGHIAIRYLGDNLVDQQGQALKPHLIELIRKRVLKASGALTNKPKNTITTSFPNA